jgi:hypothetical protein
MMGVMQRPDARAPERKRPPKKQAGQATGRRRLNGAVLDVPAMADRLGDTEKGIRAKIARGLLPYRRLGGRIAFLSDEVDAFLHQLPGVSVAEALANIAARGERPA